MHYVEARGQRLVALEPDEATLRSLAEQAGYSCEISEFDRQVVMELSPSNPLEPFVLFDAADPANLGWFSRCQFYADGLSGKVLQTPFTLANSRTDGHVQSDTLRVVVSTELPASFTLPGRQSVSEQVIYSLLFNLLTALRENGVAVCGRGSIEPLTGNRSARQTQLRLG
jgi:hypothetical protein